MPLAFLKPNLEPSVIAAKAGAASLLFVADTKCRFCATGYEVKFIRPSLESTFCILKSGNSRGLSSEPIFDAAIWSQGFFNQRWKGHFRSRILRFAAPVSPANFLYRGVALGEECHPETTDSLSEAASIAHVPETSNNRHGSLASCQETSTLENSNLSTTGSMQRWFPYDDCFKVDEKTLTSSEVISILYPIMADDRKQRIKEVIENRTYTVCIAVEGLLELGNISAVFRSADALGFQSVHIITNETTKKYKKNRKVSKGTEKWLDAEMWESSSDCIATLRERGYRIAVTHIAPDTVSIEDIDWTIPTAVFLGSECKGASEEAIKQSDIRCCIPMAGMVESFNVSVAAGILMYHAARDRIARSGTHGDISPQNRKILEAEFCSRHTGHRHTVPILERLLEKKKAKALDSPSMRIFSDDFLASIEDAEEPEGV